MASGISIGIASDTRQFQAGIDDVTDSLQKVSGTLDDLNGAGSSEKLIASLKAEQTAAKETSAQYEQLGNAATQSADTATEAFEVSTREQKSLTRDAVTTVGDNLKSALSQGAQQVSGNLGDITNDAQTAVQTLAFIGGPETLLPLGAAALGVGAISSMINNANAAAEAFQQSVLTLAGELIDVGSTGDPGLDNYITNLKQIALNGTEAGTSLKKFQDDSTTASQNFGNVAKALAGDPAALTKAISQVKSYIETLSQVKTASQGAAVGSSDQIGAADRLYAALQKQNDIQKESISEAQTAKDAGLNSLEAQAQAAQDDAKAEATAAKAKAAAIKQANEDAAQSQKDFASSLSSSLAQAGQDTSDFTTNGVVDLGKYAQSLNAMTQSVLDESANLTSIAPALTQAGLTYVEGLGEKAAPLLAEAAKLGPSSPEYQALVGSWNTAGAASGKSFGEGITAGIPAVKAAPIPVSQSLDPVSAQKMLDTLKAQKAHVNVVPVLDEAAVKTMQEELGKKAEVPVTPSLNPDAVAKMNATLKEQVKPEVAPVLNTDAVHAMKTQLAQNTSAPVIPSLDEGAVAKMRAKLDEENKPQVAPVLNAEAVQKMTEALGKQQKVPVIPDLNTDLVKQMHENIAQKQVVPVVPGLDPTELAKMRRTLTAQQSISVLIDTGALDRQIRGYRPPAITIPTRAGAPTAP